MGSLGSSHSGVLSAAGRENLVVLRRAMFAAGFRSYIEATEPISDLPSVTQLIRGKQ
jgi:hypothetical protein